MSFRRNALALAVATLVCASLTGCGGRSHQSAERPHEILRGRAGACKLLTKADAQKLLGHQVAPVIAIPGVPVCGYFTLTKPLVNISLYLYSGGRSLIPRLCPSVQHVSVDRQTAIWCDSQLIASKDGYKFWVSGVKLKMAESAVRLAFAKLP